MLVLRARDRVIGGLRDQHDRDGVLCELVVREAAASLGCSPRSVRRWLAAGTPSGQKSAVLIDDELYAVYLRWHGNVAAARRELVRAGRQLPSLRRLQRAFVRELRPAERAAARTGEPGLRAHGLYVRWEADHRNEVWQGDHKLLDVVVVPPRGRRPQRPWSTMFIDARSRVIMGWALSLRPSTAEVLAALRDAMTVQPDGPAVGGAPERLRIDHGLEFCAEAVRAASLALKVEFSVANEYTPEEKGKIERLHLTCVQTFLSGLPQYTGGRRDRKGRLDDPRAPLPLEQFVSLFADWVTDYNHRPHSELDGESPVATFTSDPTPLRTLPVADTRALLAARKEARVHRWGVTHSRHRYTSPDLSDLCRRAGRDRVRAARRAQRRGLLARRVGLHRAAAEHAHRGATARGDPGKTRAREGAAPPATRGDQGRPHPTRADDSHRTRAGRCEPAEGGRTRRRPSSVAQRDGADRSAGHSYGPAESPASIVMSRHFLELQDAATLETEHYLLARRAVTDAVDRSAMAVIHGSAGLGKTYTVDDLVEELKLRVLWTSFPSRPTPRSVAAELYQQLSGRRTRLDRFTIIARLVEHLANGPQAIVVDESQLLTGDCIELLRYLHDHRTTRFALVLVGGDGTWAVLSREPMLASRVYRRVRFQPLTRPDVLGAIPAYHPIYTDVDSELIGLVDDHFAHGNMRNWAAFTHSALGLLTETDRDRIDEQIVRNVFALHGGGADR